MYKYSTVIHVHVGTMYMYNHVCNFEGTCTCTKLCENQFLCFRSASYSNLFKIIIF